jgi:hypothetical protein
MRAGIATMTRISRAEDWLAAKIGEEMVMMSVKTGGYIGLNEVGARIWDLLETPCDIDALCARLESEYDVEPAVCRAEIEDFVAELVRHGAASIDPR